MNFFQNIFDLMPIYVVTAARTDHKIGDASRFEKEVCQSKRKIYVEGS